MAVYSRRTSFEGVKTDTDFPIFYSRPIAGVHPDRFGCIGLGDVLRLPKGFELFLQFSF